MIQALVIIAAISIWIAFYSVCITVPAEVMAQLRKIESQDDDDFNKRISNYLRGLRTSVIMISLLIMSAIALTLTLTIFLPSSATTGSGVGTMPIAMMYVPVLLGVSSLNVIFSSLLLIMFIWAKSKVLRTNRLSPDKITYIATQTRYLTMLVGGVWVLELFYVLLLNLNE